MSRFTSLFDRLGEVMAEISAAEISEANDVDDLVRGAATAADDWAYLLGRVADRLEELPGLARWIPDTFDATAGWAGAAAGDLAPLADFSLIRH